eukprot:TRINITY_DN5994_c0_g1_i1.p1 TRINITY_DN5994_c0_g1~~TRINITY_DN5994_c0_g1_i1.p1  ORF type:complete len:155 (+),score=33.74 TRINITY_DN5994_c0_g1_i1:1-465(+)
MIRRPPRSTLDRSSAASDVYKRQVHGSLNNRMVEGKLDKQTKLQDSTRELCALYSKLKRHDDFRNPYDAFLIKKELDYEVLDLNYEYLIEAISEKVKSVVTKMQTFAKDQKSLSKFSSIVKEINKRQTVAKAIEEIKESPSKRQRSSTIFSCNQ